MANFQLHQDHNSRLEVSVNLVAVGLRQLRSPSELNPLQIGNCIGTLVTPIQNPPDLAHFWSTACDLSASLDHRVRNDYSKFLKTDDTTTPEMLKGLMFHLSISNIGIVDTSKSYECFSSSANDFVIENMFTCVKSLAHADKFLCVVFLCTVGDKLCCSLGYNSYFFSPDLAREFANIFQNKLDKLLTE